MVKSKAVKKKAPAPVKKKIVKKVVKKKLLTIEQVKKKLIKLVGMEPIEQEDILLELVEKSGKKITILREQLKIYQKKADEKEEAQAPIDEPEPMNFPTEEEVEKDLVKELLNEKKLQQILEGLKENKFNWKDDKFYDSWDKIKGHMKKLLGDGKIYTEKPTKWFFMGHSNDKIIGKPQLIDDCKIRMPVVRLSIKKTKLKKGDPRLMFADPKGEVRVQHFHMVGDNFDKRYNAPATDAFSVDFYKYVVKTPGDKRFFIFSEKRLPEQNCTLTGMSMELDDFNEISKTMKIPQLSRLFFCKHAEPDVKIISKEELVEFTRSKKITEEDWLLYLAKHPLGTINNFSIEFEKLRSSFLLQGKRDGWPFGMMVMGPQGSRKTMGIIEPMDWRFNKPSNIAAATVYRLKGLIPSYKSMIADLGFLVRAERIALVDEISKMIDAESHKHDGTNKNVLGDFNDILEHKDRIGGSGNANNVNIKASAKFLFVGNPCADCTTIHSHVGLIDPTVMGRLLWWVQDEAEQELVLGENGILRSSPETKPRLRPEEKK